MRIERLEEVSSTNEYIKRYLGGRENVVVCARRQSGGRGTKGRSFLSEEGGVYLTALLFPQGAPARDAFLVMAHAAVAVCRVLERFGVHPQIKWPNDVLVGGKKICGILIENGVKGALLDHCAIGIGLNVRNNVSALGGTATSLALLLPEPPSAEEAAEALIRALVSPSDFSEYLAHVCHDGRTVQVTEGGERYEATARRVLPDGRLEIECGGTVRALSAAEVTIRL